MKPRPRSRSAPADARGALGALNVDTVRAAVQAVKGRRLTSASAGDLPMEPEALASAVRSPRPSMRWRQRACSTSRSVCFRTRGGACVTLLGARTRDTRLIGVLFADVEPDIGALPALLARLSTAGFAGAILDTRYKDPGRIIDRLGIPALAAFREACRANSHDRTCWLARCSRYPSPPAARARLARFPPRAALAR